MKALLKCPKAGFHSRKNISIEHARKVAPFAWKCLLLQAVNVNILLCANAYVLAESSLEKLLRCVIKLLM